MDGVGVNCVMGAAGVNCGLDGIGVDCGVDGIGVDCVMGVVGVDCGLDGIGVDCVMGAGAEGSGRLFVDVAGRASVSAEEAGWNAVGNSGSTKMPSIHAQPNSSAVLGRNP